MRASHYIFRELSPSFIFSWTTIANISWNALLVTAVHLKMKLVDKFYWKVLNILTSFLWSIRVQTMEKCCRFCFSQSHWQFWFPFPLKFLRESLARERRTNLPPSPISKGCVLIDHSSKRNRAREKKTLIYCKTMNFNNSKLWYWALWSVKSHE